MNQSNRETFFSLLLTLIIMTPNVKGYYEFEKKDVMPMFVPTYTL